MKPADEEWQNLLRDFHDDDPGTTPRVFGGCETDEGVNSYVGLVNTIGSLDGKRVVDLACGDGPLLHEILPKIGKNGRIIAVDMSAGEINEAKKRFTDSRITFVESVAQNLPLEEASVDVVFCHLALMLMTPIAPVLKQVARVLRSGGVFCVATQCAPSEHPEPTRSFFAWMRMEASKYLRHIECLNMGDPSFASLEGIGELFKRHPEFAEIEGHKIYHILLQGSSENLWPRLKAFYLPMLLNDSELKGMDALAMERLRAHADEYGRVTLPYACRRYMIRRK